MSCLVGPWEIRGKKKEIFKESKDEGRKKRKRIKK